MNPLFATVAIIHKWAKKRIFIASTSHISNQYSSPIRHLAFTLVKIVSDGKCLIMKHTEVRIATDSSAKRDI